MSEYAQRVRSDPELAKSLLLSIGVLVENPDGSIIVDPDYEVIFEKPDQNSLL